MNTLASELRRKLERTVVEAREIAEAGARGALEALAVHHHEPYGHMGAEQRKLRNRLRAHARHLGDRVDARSGAHAIDHLVHECAYEHWHGMLFARFLAENDLLIEPEMGVAITLDECEELAREEGPNGERDKWALAARFAHRMLPQVFRPDHPVFEVLFAREYRLKLESLVESLPEQVFTATDALGWVYQFWQTKKKYEVNRSEVRIGADELPAVTQLFTEPYMVQFLLHNSLGAWWVTRHPERSCPVDLTYLRQTEDGTPAAGAFEGWPDDLLEFRLLDPCCGSGHFLVAAFLMLVPMRMELEDLDASQAVDAVLRENIHGLELDQRCVAIAAFALALEAWRFPDAGGFRTLPKLNLAWCGQPVAGKKEQWLAFAEGDRRLEAGMTALYDTFRDAPTLGSLIDPSGSVREDMLTPGFGELQPLLEKALWEYAGEDERQETVIAAQGLAKTASLLGSTYHLIATNVPYLGSGDQSARLKSFCEFHHADAKADLATVFLSRLIGLLVNQCSVAVVLPQSWLLQNKYQQIRERFLQQTTWNLVSRLGPGAFETISGHVVNVLLLIADDLRPKDSHLIRFVDAMDEDGVAGKSCALRDSPIHSIGQLDQLNNPESRATLIARADGKTLEEYAFSTEGLSSGDAARFLRFFWEFAGIRDGWSFIQDAPSGDRLFDGLSQVVLWDAGQGDMATSEGARIRGHSAWGQPGIVISKISGLRCAMYFGGLFSKSCVVMTPRAIEDLPALLSYCLSEEYAEEVKHLSKSLAKSTSAFEQVPFDVEKWREQGQEFFGDTTPSPGSIDLSHWIFAGSPANSAAPLHVSVARLLAYRWPAEFDADMDLADEQREWIYKTKSLCHFADEDGIVCIPSVRGERPAYERLLQLLNAAYGDDWHDGILTKLLAEAGSASLDDWLRNQFFDEHCKLFQHRPFIWHIWDGRKRDGFHALVNYHKLTESNGKGLRLLESLTYSYLGDWIGRQQDGVKRGEGGAEDRLAAALELQKRLVAILEGEPPFDLFVRWKPIEEQPIGWEPDINDGVRLNIRPFMAQDLPAGKKGAGVLRAKPNIHWKKDRGKEPTRDQDQFPWFWKNGKFTGERVNDVHLTNAEKRAARKKTGGKQT